MVSDGRTFAERERESAQHRIALADPRSLTYRQVNTTPRYRITKTYVTDPHATRWWSTSASSRSPAAGSGSSPSPTPRSPTTATTTPADRGPCADREDADAGRARRLARLQRTSNGYLAGATAGPPRSDCRMELAYASATTATSCSPATPFDGVPRKRMTLVMGFGENAAAACGTARSTLAGLRPRRLGRLRGRLGPHLRASRAAALGERAATTYDVSVMTLAAHEDKAYRAPHRLAGHAVGGRQVAIRTRARPTTRCGHATSTRSPPRARTPATRPAPQPALGDLFDAPAEADGCSRGTPTRRRRREVGPSSSTRSPCPSCRLAAGPPRREDVRGRAAVQRRAAPLPALADRRPLRPRSPPRRASPTCSYGAWSGPTPPPPTAPPTVSSPGSHRRPPSSPSTPCSFMSIQIARTRGLSRHEAANPSIRLRPGVPASWWQPSPADRRHLLACTRRP